MFCSALQTKLAKNTYVQVIFYKNVLKTIDKKQYIVFSRSTALDTSEVAAVYGPYICRYVGVGRKQGVIFSMHGYKNTILTEILYKIFQPRLIIFRLL